MIENLFRPTHLLMIALVYMVFFGSNKLPDLGKHLAQGIRGFKEAMREAETALRTPAEPPKPDGA